MPLEARLPRELWSCVFAHVTDPATAAMWRATSTAARALFDSTPGHDPSCGGNRALYEACRRSDEATVERLLADPRVVAGVVDAPNPHGSLFGHQSRWIACRLLACKRTPTTTMGTRGGATGANTLRLTTADIDAACANARDDDAVPLMLLASVPTRLVRPLRSAARFVTDAYHGDADGAVPTVASAVGVTEACIDCAIAHRQPVLVRALMAFVASHRRGTRDYADLPARAAVAAVRRGDASMLRLVLDADGYRTAEAVAAGEYGDDAETGEPLCEAVRWNWTEAIRFIAAHRRYDPKAFEGRSERNAVEHAVALAYWMAVRMRHVDAVKALAKHLAPWRHVGQPDLVLDDLLASGPTRTLAAVVASSDTMALGVAHLATRRVLPMALAVCLVRVRHVWERRMPEGTHAGHFVRTVDRIRRATDDAGISTALMAIIEHINADSLGRCPIVATVADFCDPDATWPTVRRSRLIPSTDADEWGLVKRLYFTDPVSLG